MKSLDFYMNLPYTLIVEADEEGGFRACVRELPGCIAQGDSEQAAWERLQQAKKEWLCEAWEQGLNIPEPSVLREAIEAAITMKQAENSETNLEMLLILQRIKEGVLTLDEALALFTTGERPQETLRELMRLRIPDNEEIEK